MNFNSQIEPYSPMSEEPSQAPIKTNNTAPVPAIEYRIEKFKHGRQGKSQHCKDNVDYKNPTKYFLIPHPKILS